MEVAKKLSCLLRQRSLQPFIALTLQRRLNIRLRLGQSDHLARFLPLSAFLEQIDALKTFQDVALGRDGAGPLETAML